MKNRLLTILRRWGLYHGPIHYRMKAETGRVGAVLFPGQGR